jgi:hypothetical protein
MKKNLFFALFGLIFTSSIIAQVTLPQLDSVVYKNWNGTTTQNNHKYIFDYDENQINTDATYYNWDNPNQVWTDFYRFQYSYNEDGRVS